MILDTNAVSALLAGHDIALNSLLQGNSRQHLPLPVVAEYQYGILALNRPQRLAALLRRLEAESAVLCPDRATADHYAAIAHDLRQRGTPIPENDLWIAALARQYSLPIVSRDAHFDYVAGIRRLGW